MSIVMCGVKIVKRSNADRLFDLNETKIYELNVRCYIEYSAYIANDLINCSMSRKF